MVLNTGTLDWESSALTRISFKAVMLMPNLFLQKPSKSSKSKDYQLALERCLDYDTKMNLKNYNSKPKLFIQASVRTIQKPLSIAEISPKFKKYMPKGNISSVLYLLTNNMENGV